MLQHLHTVMHEYTYVQPGSSPCPHGNCLKSVKWSPDGACMLTASEDAWMRVYDLPSDCVSAPVAISCTNVHPSIERAKVSAVTGVRDVAMTKDDSADTTLQAGHVQSVVYTTTRWSPSLPDTMGAALRVQEGECVYDYAWFSRMSVLDDQSCCFATTCRGLPVHLWDATTGQLRATYRGYNDVDEVTSAHSLAFSPDGSHLYAGYTKWMLVFDVTRPGRENVTKISCGLKHPVASEARLSGIVSCMAFAPDGSRLAVGSYGRQLGVYDPRVPELQLVLSGHRGGITQVLFTNDGHFLLSGARQDPDLICWDLRGGRGAVGDPYALYHLKRDTDKTNQKVGFSLDPWGRYVATGTASGTVKVFDLQTGQTEGEWATAKDTVTGCDWHPSLNILAVASGHRRFPSLDETQTSSATRVQRAQDTTAEQLLQDEPGSGCLGKDQACRQLHGPALQCCQEPDIHNALRIFRVPWSVPCDISHATPVAPA